MSLFISDAWAQTGSAAGGDMFTMFLPLILIFAVFYFLLIRPQQKRQKEHQAKLAAVRRGDKIITGGGFYATVVKVLNDQELQVDLAEGVRVRVATSTIMDVLSKPEPVKGNAPANSEKKSGGLLGSLFGGGKKEK